MRASGTTDVKRERERERERESQVERQGLFRWEKRCRAVVE
jgi:hypothetical protein